MAGRMIQEVIAGRPLVTAEPQMTVRAAAALMTEKRVGALLVVDGEGIAGIFTERDALTKVLAEGRDPDKTRLAMVMVARPLTIGLDRSLAQALLMMADGGFRHVPVVDGSGRAVGMLSARDALGQEQVDLERNLRRIEDLEKSLAY